MTTTNPKIAIELTDISDDVSSDSSGSQLIGLICPMITIEDEELHSNQESSRKSSKTNGRTSVSDANLCSVNKFCSKLCNDTVKVVNSKNNGGVELNIISVNPGPSVLSPSLITYPIKKISLSVNESSETEDVEKRNTEVPRKKKEKKIRTTNFRKETEKECNCCPPIHKCKKFANPLKNSKPTINIAIKSRNISQENEFKCDICLKEFSMEWVLTRHQLIHEDSASWNKCPFCVYKTPYVGALKVHIRKHVKVRCSERKKSPVIEKIFSPKTTEIKKESVKPYWNCVFCKKKYKYSKRCEQHELRCEESSLSPTIRSHRSSSTEKISKRVSHCEGNIASKRVLGTRSLKNTKGDAVDE